MRHILLSFISLVALWATATTAQNSVVDAFVAREGPIAKAGLLANIGPSGSKSQGAKVCRLVESNALMLTLFFPVRSRHCESEQVEPRLRLHMDARRRLGSQGHR